MNCPIDVQDRATFSRRSLLLLTVPSDLESGDV